MGNFTIIGIIFLASFLMFHLVLATRFSTRRFWIAIDYIWVGLALLTVISKVIEIRKAEAQMDFAEQQIALTDVYMRALDQTTVLQGFYSNHNNGSINDSVNKKRYWYETLKDSILNNHNSLLAENNMTRWKGVENYYSHLFTGADSTDIKMKQALNMELGILDNRLSKINADKASSLESPFEKKLFSFAPFMVIIAVALRLTKVSFELRMAGRRI